jgi:hypothetical protein
MKMKQSFMLKVGIVAASIMLCTPAVATNNNVSSALLMALDDEYKAYATYDVIINKFGDVRPFINIKDAEVRHIDAVKYLLGKYNIPIPANKYMTANYRPAAPQSLKAACEAGRDAEISNAALYDQKLFPMVKGYDDITMIFQNLRDASQYRHLPAFERCTGFY